MSLAQRRRAAVSELLKDSIIHLCRLNSLFDGQIEVDGIICISGQGEGEEIIVKVHERLQTAGGSTPSPFGLPSHSFTARPSDRGRLGAVWASAARDDASALKAALRQTNSLHNHEQEVTREPEDLRKTPRSSSAINAVPRAASPIPDDEDRSMVSSPGSNMSPSEATTMNGGQGSETSSHYNHKPSRWPGEFNMTPECHVCNQTFDNFDMLSEHNETLHNSFTCAYCHKTFTSRSNLERHARLHTGHKPYACTICNRAFSRKDHLTNHASKHAFKCGACSKRFADRSMLTTHFFQEHNSATVNVCQFCNKGFADYAAYEEHAKVHPQFNLTDKNFNLPAPLFMLNRRLQCRNCSFIATDKLCLSKHQLMHGESTKVSNTCLACNKTFADPLTLGSHMELHAHETNVFECAFCRLVLPTLQVWKRHEQSHVSDLDDHPMQTHSCSQCDKAFLSQSHLLEHLAVHDMSRQPFPSPLWMKAVNSGRMEEESTDRWKGTGEKIVDAENLAEMREAKGDTTRSTPSKAGKASDGILVTEIPGSVIEVKPEPVKGSNNLGKSRKQERPQKLNKEPSSGGWDMPIVSPLLAISAMAANHTLEYRPGFYSSPTSNMAIDLTQRSSDYTPPDDSSESRRTVSVSSTPSKMTVDIPAGPHVCTICNGLSFDNFALYETHCVNDHNRSPCMFCVKTFAQKANRDRHVCLHTGDKPYACPFCEERFSRGDKLKLHKTRVHKIGEPSCSSPDGTSKMSGNSKLLSGMGLLENEGDMQQEVSNDWSSREENGSFYQWNAPMAGSLNVHEAGEWQAQVMETHSENGDNTSDAGGSQ